MQDATLNQFNAWQAEATLSKTLKCQARMHDPKSFLNTFTYYIQLIASFYHSFYAPTSPLVSSLPSFPPPTTPWTPNPAFSAVFGLSSVFSTFSPFSLLGLIGLFGLIMLRFELKTLLGLNKVLGLKTRGEATRDQLGPISECGWLPLIPAS